MRPSLASFSPLRPAASLILPPSTGESESEVTEQPQTVLPDSLSAPHLTLYAGEILILAIIGEKVCGELG
ncbi:unnamed protein product [Protopolystoma xenopodis]|uniref:Uncharacterized protein n=1 Tax=Protopolystoma xenopodis TaxID=117903 RepID=A0A3S5CJH6_9PLAT|nr:unnamed protein product [Protopolystoma xenopodis]